LVLLDLVGTTIELINIFILLMPYYFQNSIWLLYKLIRIWFSRMNDRVTGISQIGWFNCYYLLKSLIWYCDLLVAIFDISSLVLLFRERIVDVSVITATDRLPLHQVPLAQLMVRISRFCLNLWCIRVFTWFWKYRHIYCLLHIQSIIWLC